MLRDARGLEVSTDRVETIAAIDRMVDEAMAYGTELGCILSAADAEPEGVMANSLAAMLMMWLENATSRARAECFLQRARRGLKLATERERLFFAAIETWVKGDVARSIAALELIAEDHPRDLMVLKLGHYHYLNRGRFEEMAALSQKLLSANDDCSYVLGCHAFALEELGEFEAAEELGRQAVAAEPDDAWAQHAVAHVLDTQCRLSEGIAWLREHADGWQYRNSFMRSHNWWHLALLYLDIDDVEQALALYDNEVWGVDKSYSQDQANAISLLWRLELRGVDTGRRWQALGDYAAQRTEDCLLAFLNLHYLLALLCSDQHALATKMVEGIDRAGRTAGFGDEEVWHSAALPVAKALMHAHSAEWAAAVRQFQWAEPYLQQLGGSHAQRDLFAQTCLHVLQQAERYERSAALLEERAVIRADVADTFRQLARAYHGLGEAAQADRAHTQADLLHHRYAGLRSQ